jgi:hypothetical protein
VSSPPEWALPRDEAGVPLRPILVERTHAGRADGAADEAVRAATVAKDAAREAAKAVPKADPRQSVDFERLSNLEESMLARISPRHRNRWPELQAIDERLAELDHRQEELHATLIDLHGRRERADAEHAASLAEWMASEQTEPKPVSEAQALEAGIAESEAQHAAIDIQRDRVLEERIAFVGKHRMRLVADAERAIERAKTRLLELVDELEHTREELVRRKIPAKLAAWEDDVPPENLTFLSEPWGKFRLSNEEHRTALAAYINENKIDVLVAGPIVSPRRLGH